MYIIKELKKKKQYLNPHDFIPGGIYVQKNANFDLKPVIHK
jgi:hypothetical protein